ncbi:Aquaporin Z [Tenacibaculum sp. 190524A02b]|uniref:Aquaporin Z n=1 Tax=Tenacibaculum vairaonense TaxID=3137860 RepID=A0ABP1FL66_9FLAO
MKKYIAEFIGTFLLIFCGTGAIIVNQYSNDSLGLLGIALTFGITVCTMIYVFGNISGTHINPSVTIALALGKLTSKKEAFFYILSQMFGAISASFLLQILFPKTSTLGNTIPVENLYQAFIMECLLTFLLMLTILAVNTKKELATNSGLIIGTVIIGIILLAGPISGGSFNPARSIAPAIVSRNYSALWIYIIAPTLGAIMGMFSWKSLHKTT